MNAITPIRLGGIIPVPNMRNPVQQSQSLPCPLDFTNAAALNGDLQGAFQTGVFDFVQSVFIDNSQNAASFSLVFPGAGPLGQTITAQPYSQGYYPCSPSVGDGRFVAITSQGQIVPVIFYNVAMPYFTWGPAPGVLIVPALTNAPLNFAPLAVGDNQIVAGALRTTIKTYRLWLAFGGNANVQFFDGASAGNVPLTGIIPMYPGGSITLQPSGVPWFTDAADTALVMKSDTASNCGGMIGYVQN
jgi:hypothetical protein